MKSYLKTIFAVGAIATVGSYAAYAQENPKMRSIRSPVTQFKVQVQGLAPTVPDGTSVSAPTLYSVHIGGDKYHCAGLTCNGDRPFAVAKDVQVRFNGGSCKQSSTGHSVTDSCAGDLSQLQQGGTIIINVNPGSCSCSFQVTN